MIRLYITPLVLLVSTLAFGQRTGLPPSSPVNDTVRTETIKKGKVKIVDGAIMNSGRDVIYNLSQSSNYSQFVKAVRTAGLIETFKSKGPITVFVPDNSAFAKLTPPGRMDTLLMKSHLLELSNLVTYHAIPGNIKSKDLAKLIQDGNGQATLTTVAGGKLVAHIDANRNIVLVDELGNQSIISRFDIPQSNGMVHIVTQVLVPRYKTI